MKARPTQSRKGVKGQCPLWGQGAKLPCGAWGNAPTVPRATIILNALNKGAGSEASLPVTLRVRRRAPKLLCPQLAYCRAKWARPSSWSYNQSCSFAQAGVSRLWARPKGNENRRSLRSPFGNLRSAHPCFLIFIVAGGTAPAGATRGLCGRPLDPFARRHSCYLVCIVT